MRLVNFVSSKEALNSTSATSGAYVASSDDGWSNPKVLTIFALIFCVHRNGSGGDAELLHSRMNLHIRPACKLPEYGCSASKQS